MRPAPSTRCRGTLSHFVPKVALALALLLIAAPVWAYIIVLKDGTQILAKGKYRIEGDKAHFAQPNGVATFISATEIDFAATERANESGGSAKVLIDEKTDQKRTVEKKDEEPAKETLGDLIGRRRVGLKLPEVRRRDTEGLDEVPLTAAGYPDLLRIKRMPHQDGDVASELMRYLQGQRVEGVRIYQGTQRNRAFIEAVAGSEAIVFKVLKDAASALVQVHDRFPDRIEAIELLLSTRSQVRAAQFEITPELANALVSEKIEPSSFFYRYVQF